METVDSLQRVRAELTQLDPGQPVADELLAKLPAALRPRPEHAARPALVSVGEVLALVDGALGAFEGRYSDAAARRTQQTATQGALTAPATAAAGQPARAAPRPQPVKPAVAPPPAHETPKDALDRLYALVIKAPTLSAAVAKELLRQVPLGVEWGWRDKEPPPTYLARMKAVGLTEWNRSPFEPVDLEFVSLILSKAGRGGALGKATVRELVLGATAILEKSPAMTGKKEEFRAELLELVEQEARRMLRPGTQAVVAGSPQCEYALALSSRLTPREVLSHMYRFVNGARAITPAEAKELLAHLPTGVEWGWEKKSPPVSSTARLKELGLGEWAQGDFESMDIEIVSQILAKVTPSPPLTPPLAGELETLAMKVLGGSKGAVGKKARYLDDLHEGVRLETQRLTGRVPLGDLGLTHQRALERTFGDSRVRESDNLAAQGGRLPTLEELTAICRRLRARQDIPWDYIGDGCYARAHLMAAELTKEGINVGKLFVFEENPPPHLVVKNQLMSAEWWYHVSPLVFVRTAEGIRPFVIDPALSNDPLTPQEWLRRFTFGQITVEVTNRAQYSPRRSRGLQTDFNANLARAAQTCQEYLATLRALRAKKK